jgi:two-component system phosphate regulon sensor histidine kinase PhoR
MADILLEVSDLLRQQARAKDQTLEVQVASHPYVTIQRDHLEQIWMNLLSNAIKYTPAGGHIEATLKSDGSHAVGIVEDSGIGISEADQERLFQEFFRADEAKATGEPGTGLGLSIVKQIVDAYQGNIQVDSHPGRGTRFTFILPTTPAKEIQPLAAQAT